MKAVRFGIIGTGMIAKVHAMAIRDTEGAELVAVYDAVPERARSFATEHGCAAETTLKGLLRRRNVDAVTISTPSGVRADVAVPAARAGKHILCEKPMEITVKRADRILEACQKNNVVLACVFQSRTLKSVQTIRKALDAGRFGKLLLVDAQVKWFRTHEYYASASWRGTWKLDGGGALMNQSVHTVDLMLYFGGPPKSVYAQTDTFTHKIEVEDTAVATVRFVNGAMGSIVASTSCAPGFPRRIEVSGERGSAIVEDDRLIRWSFVDQSPDDERILAEGMAGENMAGGSANAAAITHIGHARQIADLVQAIQQKRDPMVPGAEGRRSVELICGIYKSARTGKPVLFKSA